LRYIKGTSDATLCYEGSESIVIRYVDSDFVGDLKKRKSIIGYVFTITRRAISQVSKLHMIVALSTTEAKCMVAT
jgi:hypothetical protein